MNDDVKQRLAQALDTSQRLRRLYDRLKVMYESSSLFAHGWDHIHRVLLNALWIIGQSEEEVNVEVVIAATLLHDIGFLYNLDPYVHHEVGAKHCHIFLDEWDSEEIRAIEGCILKHKGMMPKFNIRPTSIEERIVCDADLLEKSGYIGLMQGIRTFVEFGEGTQRKYRSLYEIAANLMKIREIEFFTSAGKALSQERGDFALRADVMTAALRELECYHSSEPEV